MNIESNLARPVIIQITTDWGASTYFHSKQIRLKYSHIVDFLDSRWIETVPTSIDFLLRPTLGQSDEPDLDGSLSPTSVYSTWQSPIQPDGHQTVTHPIMNRARRCLTSVIEPTTISERLFRIYGANLKTWGCWVESDQFGFNIAEAEKNC